jgi:endoglucanase
MKKIVFLTFVVSLTLQLSACGSSGSAPPVVNNPPPTVPAPGGGNGNPIEEPVYPDYNSHPIAADANGMPSDAVQLASKIKLGWNIGNTMEAIGGETAWGNPLVSKELLQLVKSSGFDAVRLPAAWDQYANQETAEISQDWLNRIKQVVQDCIDNDLYVVLNIHWDGGWLENNITADKQQSNNAKQKAFWQQIATQLRDFDEHLIFASANEPNAENAEQMDVLLSYHQTFIDAVRATGGKNAYRVLVVQGPATDIEKTNQLFTQMPVDSVPARLMAEVHFYTPYNFALMQNEESWGKPFYYWGENYHSTTDLEHNTTWGEETTIDELFASMKVQFVDLGIPVVLGEFSAMRRTNLSGNNLQLHLASRAYYHKYVVERALANGLLPFYWDNGATDNFSSGLFNRQQDMVFDQQVLNALLEGAGK